MENSRKRLVLTNLNSMKDRQFEQIANLKSVEDIESIILNGFTVNEKLIKILNNFRNLATLTLNHCDIEPSNVILNLNLKSLIITYSKVLNLDMLANKESITEIKLINLENELDLSMLKDFKNLEKLSLLNFKVSNFEYITKLGNIKELVLDGSTIDNTSVVEKLKATIKISFDEKFLPDP